LCSYSASRRSAALPAFALATAAAAADDARSGDQADIVVAMTVIDERAWAGPEHLDPSYVAGYEHKANADHDEALTLLRQHGFGQGSTLVDLGAGTGSFALAAAAECKHVVAVDVSPAMVDAIRANAATRGLTNVEAVEAGFLSYTHDDGPVDVVHTRHALHHLPDLWKAVALRRAARLLRPGGLLYLRDLVFSFELDDSETTLERWLAGAASSPDQGWTRAELETHLRDEFSTFTWLLEPMLEHADLSILEARYSDGIYAEYLCGRP
jgi:ubiquinone/menaquinone biosynthesis C-methylase UbiE